MTGQIQSTTETTKSNTAAPEPKTASAANPKLPSPEHIFELLTPVVESIGYELVHIELLNHREKTLRIYIDLGPNAGARPAGEEGIGVEDCAIVSRGLDEPLEKMKEIDAYFGNVAYELEVSSPGVDRPLRKAKDFEKFSGRDIRIQTLRPLTGEELGNADYVTRNSKQKNFIGILGGMDAETGSVKMTILASMGVASKTVKKPKKGAKGEAKLDVKSDAVLIPISLIAKANIEPDFED